MEGHASSLRDDREKATGAKELFFSTTDRRGAIRQGNSVFVRVSGFSREELAGAPHNIVRHPDMPGGAFRLVWDRLEMLRELGDRCRTAVIAFDPALLQARPAAVRVAPAAA